MKLLILLGLKLSRLVEGSQISIITYLEDLITWWRHQMETFSALLAICAGNSPVNSPHKGQWRGALMFTLICARINGWVNNREAGDLRRYRPHYDVIVMKISLHAVDKHVPSSTHMSPWHPHILAACSNKPLSRWHNVTGYWRLACSHNR